MILRDAYNLGIKLLNFNSYIHSKKIFNPDINTQTNVSLEVRLLLQHILSINELTFLTNQDLPINQEQIDHLKKLISLRKTGYPLAYILGYKYFWKNKFFVNKNVLIPRPDTETLVQAVIDSWKNNYKNFVNPITILDIGTGSGCIILSLLQEIPNSKGVASDISKEALLVAKKNIEFLNINLNQIYLVQQDLFSALNVANKYDFIISNPPYIAYDDKLIQQEVKTYEPKLALFANQNGLFFYQKIFQSASNFLKKTGYLFLEIGINQKNDVIKLSQKTNLKFKKSILDDNSIERVLIFSL